MNQTVKLDTLNPESQQYACRDRISYAVREPMISLIYIHQVFTEKLEPECFNDEFNFPDATTTKLMNGNTHS